MALADFEGPQRGLRSRDPCFGQFGKLQGDSTKGCNPRYAVSSDLRPGPGTWASPYLWVSVDERTAVRKLSPNGGLKSWNGPLSHQYNDTQTTSRYLHYIQTNLNNLGLTFLFDINVATNMTFNQLKNMIILRAKDQYLQKWQTDMQSSNKAIFYRSIQTELQFEQYLDILNFTQQIT